jgi:hypothetical protein
MGRKLGGFHGGKGCCCAACDVKFQAQYCGILVAGVSVVVKLSGSTIASGVTDSTGAAVLDVGSANTYSITITLGSATRTVSRAVACGSTVTVGFVSDPTLVVTDSGGTHSVSGSGSSFQFCYELTVASSSTCEQNQGGGGCDVPLNCSSSTNCDVVYTILCNLGVWSVSREWHACCCGNPTAAYATSTVMNLTTCTSTCGIVVTDSGSATPPVLSFPFNVTLTNGSAGFCSMGGSPLNSPLSTTVTIDI